MVSFNMANAWRYCTGLGNEIPRKREMSDLIASVRVSPELGEFINPDCRAIALTAQKDVYPLTKDR